MNKKVIAIVAMDEERAIGKNNTLPWHIPEDLKRFSELTRGNTVLMGRKTYLSLPERVRPLPGRKNVVISSSSKESLGVPPEVDVFSSPEEFFLALENNQHLLPGQIIWVIGGAKLFESTMRLWDELFLTIVKGNHDGDVFFPPFESKFEKIEEEKADSCSFLRYKRRPDTIK
jgi:dihydrofolate reductase